MSTTPEKLNIDDIIASLQTWITMNGKAQSAYLIFSK